MARSFLQGFEGTVPVRTHDGQPTGTNISGFFIVSFGTYNAYEKTISIFLEQYESKVAWEAGQTFINRYRYNINEDLGYNTYFTETKLKQSGKSLLSQGIALLSTIDGTHAADQNNLDLTQFTAAT